MQSIYQQVVTNVIVIICNLPPEIVMHRKRRMINVVFLFVVIAKVFISTCFENIELMKLCVLCSRKCKSRLPAVLNVCYTLFKQKRTKTS